MVAVHLNFARPSVLLRTFSAQGHEEQLCASVRPTSPQTPALNGSSLGAIEFLVGTTGLHHEYHRSARPHDVENSSADDSWGPKPRGDESGEPGPNLGRLHQADLPFLPLADLSSA
jgi:hypothetical protein